MLPRAFHRMRVIYNSVRSTQTLMPSTYFYTSNNFRKLIYSINFKKIHISAFLLECWKCGSGVHSASLFCNKCHTLQKPDDSQSFFKVIGIKEGYIVDDKEITTKFRKLQNVLHPDRFSAKDEEERQISENYSSLVNKAYSTLMQPLARGLYMLQMQGIHLEEDTKETDPQFLAVIMESNEELADAQHPDDIRKLDRANKDMMTKLTRETASAFKAGDIDAAKQTLVKMKYYSSIGARIKELKQKSGIE